MLLTNVVEIIKAHIPCSIFFSENCLVYEMMWKKYCRSGQAQMAIWRMRIACWITKATNIIQHKPTKCTIL